MNTFWKKLLFPPVRLTVILLVFTAAAVPYIFLNGLEQSLVAYVVYAVSFYAVCVTALLLARVLPKRYGQLRQKVYEHPVGNRYLTDMEYKIRVSLYASLAVNLLYVGVNLLSCILYRSVWFVVLAAYYVILAVMRFLLVRYVRARALGKDRMGELRRARLCSGILLLLNLVLTGAVMMILYENKGFEYHGILIYVMASYTFYITAHAIVDLVKYRKYKSPVMTMSKVISLSAALVSMLSLETAMFSQFGGDMAPENQWLMIALTGAGVSIAVVAMSVYVIVKTAKEIKEGRKNG